MATLRTVPALTSTPSVLRVRLSTRGWAFLILLAAFALRAHALGAKSLWYDELRQVEVAQLPPDRFVEGLLVHAARPLDYLVTRALLAGGQQEFWLRLPALWWGTLSVAVFYTVARRWLGRGPALWAAALLGTSPFAVQYAQEQRPYALFLLLALLGLWSLERALDPRRPRPRAWVAFALTAALGCLTHFFYTPLLGAQLGYGGTLLSLRRRRANAWRPLASLGAAGLAGLAALQVAAKPEHLLLFARQFLGALGGAAAGGVLASETGAPLQLTQTLNADFFLKGLLPSLGAGPSAAALLLFNGLALLGLFRLAVRDRPRLWLAAVWLAAAPALVVVYLQFRQQFFALRYVIFALPVYLLLVAGGLAWLAALPRPAWARRGLTLALLAALLGCGLAEVRADYRLPKDDWRRVGAFLTANARPGDTLGAPDVQFFIRFYAPDQPAAIVASLARGPHEEALANGERFWFVWSDYTLVPIPETRAWANDLTGVTFQLDPRIRVIFVHPGRTQAEMLAEAEGFVVPEPSIR